MVLLGKDIIYGVSFFLGIVGGIIIVIGAFVAIFRLFQLVGLKNKQKKFITLDLVRQEMGRYIVLGLEFFIGKDVLQSIFVPSWNDIGMLFALIVMRTILSYFLNRDIGLTTQQKKP